MIDDLFCVLIYELFCLFNLDTFCSFMCNIVPQCNIFFPSAIKNFFKLNKMAPNKSPRPQNPRPQNPGPQTQTTQNPNTQSSNSPNSDTQSSNLNKVKKSKNKKYHVNKIINININNKKNQKLKTHGPNASLLPRSQVFKPILINLKKYQLFQNYLKNFFKTFLCLKLLNCSITLST